MPWPRGEMRALVMSAPGVLEERKVSIPGVRSGQVLVRVAHVGVCGSDVELLNGRSYYLSEGLNAYPLIFGHEVSGVVEAVAEDVTTVQAGDRVLGVSLVTCGACAMCLRGRRNLCTHRAEIGLCGMDGGAADYVRLPAHAVLQVPDGLALHEAILVEPSVVVAHAMDRVRVAPSDRVAVVGTGTLGLVGVQLARAHGATVDAIGIDEPGLVMAKELGAHRTLRPDEASPDSYDVVLEFSGAAAAYASLGVITAAGGRIALAGVVNDEVTGVVPARFTLKDITLHGVFDGVDHYGVMLDLFARGDVTPAALIDSRLAFERAREAFEKLERRELTRPKVIIDVAL